MVTRKTFKKMMSWVLALAMLSGLMPVIASAEAPLRIESGKVIAFSPLAASAASEAPIIALDEGGVTERVWARGTAVVIQEDGGGTKLFLDDGSGSATGPALFSDRDISGLWVYGGWNDGNYTTDTSIVVESGTVPGIYGGNRSGTLTGDTSVVIKGGNLSAATVYGGSRQGNVDGNTYVSVTDGTIGWLYGSCFSGTVTGTANVTLDGGTVTNFLSGGGNDALARTENTNIVINSGTASPVYGGGFSGTVSGTATVTVTNASVDVLYGGGNQASATTGNTNVVINSGAVVSRVYGGGWSGAVTGTANVTLDGGTVTSFLYGGGNQASATTGNTNVVINSGAAVSWVHGGGREGAVSGTATVTVANASVDALYGGGDDALATTGNTNVVINSGAVVSWVFGGGGYGAVTGTAGVTVNGGTVGSYDSTNNLFTGGVYGGGSAATATVGNTNILITGGTFNSHVVGGGFSGKVLGDTNVEISNGVFNGRVLGGGLNGDALGDTYLTISNGIFNGEKTYGGGFNSDVKGDTNVVITGGIFTHEVHGGGSGGEVVGSTNVTVSGGKFYQLILGGGELGNVIRNTTVTFSGGDASTIIGGGLDGNVGGDSTVYVTGGLIHNGVFAGGAAAGAAVTGTATVIVFAVADIRGEVSETGWDGGAVGPGSQVLYERPVTFHLNGGQFSSTAPEYYLEGTDLILPVPERPGHTFGGWYDNEGLMAAAVTAISGAERGSKEFWAKWTSGGSYDGDSYNGGGSSPRSNPSGSFGSAADANIFPKGSGANMTYTVQKAFNLFRDVLVNGTAITRNTHYRAESGSTIITLLPDYLDTLEAGWYALSVRFTDGTTAAANFTVAADVAAPEPTPTPTEPPDDIGISQKPDTDAAVLFADVSADDWFASAVMYVYENGFMMGTNTDPMTFSPHMTLTRGMAVTVLHRIAGSPNVSGFANPFNDVPDTWYTNAVKWAAAGGIVNGTGGGKFSPDSNITRQDLAVILNNYAKFAGMDLPQTREYGAFADDADIRNYAREAVERFFRAMILNGKPGNLFDPQGSATRAEFAAMLMRFVEGAE